MHNKRSIGKLRHTTRRKPKSPNLTGRLCLQRTTMTEFAQEFRETGTDQIDCNIAGWLNVDGSGKYITVELSALFKPTPPPTSIEELLGDDEPREE
jgi:hypothetical protein